LQRGTTKGNFFS